MMLSKVVNNLLSNLDEDENYHQKSEVAENLLFYDLIVKDNLKTRKKKKSKKQKEDKTQKYLTRLPVSVLLDNNIVLKFLHVNEYEGITYFNKESFQLLLKWILLVSVLINYSTLKKTFLKEKGSKKESSEPKPSRKKFESEFLSNTKEMFITVTNLTSRAENFSFDLMRLRKELKRKKLNSK